MVKMILVTMMMNSWFFSNSFHPLLMTLSMIIQTMFMSFLIHTMNTSSWLSLTILLVMVGGLMIIFMYMTSITSNKLMMNKSLKKYMIMMIIYLPMMYMYTESPFSESLTLTDNFNKEYFKMYSQINFQSSLFMFFYLILILIVVMKMITMIKGPMRKKY